MSNGSAYGRPWRAGTRRSRGGGSLHWRAEPGALRVFRAYAVGSVAVLAWVLAAPLAAAEPASKPAQPLRLAARSLDASTTLGTPVLVTRSDVESALGRLRSLELDAGAANPVPRADPAFKAVLLTPRESTGRPAQPLFPEIPLVEPEAQKQLQAPGEEKEGVMTLQSYSPAAGKPGSSAPPKAETAKPSRGDESSRPASTREPSRTTAEARKAKAAPTQSGREFAAKPAAPARKVAAAPPPRAAAPAPARRAAAPAARYGAAEIAATRAFTRF